jgi:hypothetical protein
LAYYDGYTRHTYLDILKELHISVGIATEESGFDSWQEQEIFLPSRVSISALGPTNIMGTGGYVAGGKAARGVKPTIHLHLVLRLRIVELYLHSTTHLNSVLFT